MNDEQNTTKKEKSKINFNEILDIFIGIINRTRVGTHPKFHKTWRCVSLSGGVKQVYEETPNGLRPVSDDEVWQEIAAYSMRSFLPNESLYLLPSKAKIVAEAWKAYSETEKPRLFSFRDESKIAYVRLPWKEGEHLSTATPLFDEMFSRMGENNSALRQFIGSLFVDESDRQQYVWIVGRGQDGKGSLLRVLHDVLGNLFCTKQARRDGDKHWGASLVGKRLCAFPDTNNSGFCQSGFFKSLTGDDPIEVDEKFKPVYTTRINTKFFFLSNTTPDLSGQHSDKRRIILIDVEPLPKEPSPSEVASYEARLKEEANAFLDKCIHEFKVSRNDMKEPIVCGYEVFEDVSADREERFDVIANDQIIFGDHYEMEPHVLLSIMRDAGFNNFDTKNFKEHLRRKYGVTKIKAKRHGETVRIYKGMARRVAGGHLKVLPPTHTPKNENSEKI